MREPRAVASFWLCIRRLFPLSSSLELLLLLSREEDDWCYFLRDSVVYF